MSEPIRPRIANRFVEVMASRQAKSAIEAAFSLGYPALITGAPGTGKTTALMHHVKAYDGVYCAVGLADKTHRGMLEMLVSAYQLWNNAQYLNKLSEIVYSCLSSERGKLLIVDEYQTMEPAVLRELLNIQETCGIALVLSGNTERLAGTRRDEAAIEQINSRIGVHVKIGSPLPEDCVSIGVEFNVEGKDAYDVLKAYGCRSSLRQLVQLLEIAEGLSGGLGSLQLHHLEQAALMKHGDPNALTMSQKDK